MRRLRSQPRRGAFVMALAMLASAAAGYAIASSLLSSRGEPSARQSNGASTLQHPALASPVAPAWLGVDTTDLPGFGGALIVNVFPGSPAGAAGLEPGDVITQIGARPVGTAADLEAILAGLRAGDQVKIDYQRGPVTATAQTTLVARPPHTP